MTGATVNFALITELGPSINRSHACRTSRQLDCRRIRQHESQRANRCPTGHGHQPDQLPRRSALSRLRTVTPHSDLDLRHHWSQCCRLLASNVWALDMGAYWDKHEITVHAWEIFSGLGKSLFFGCIIALVACRRGYAPKAVLLESVLRVPKPWSLPQF